MQIRAVARDNTFVLRWYERLVSLQRAYGNYPKGVTTIAWISGKTGGIDPNRIYYGFTVCWKASSSVLPTARLPTWKASRELCLEALSELLRVLSDSYVETYETTSNLRIYATDNGACRACKDSCLTIYLFFFFRNKEERSFNNYIKTKENINHKLLERKFIKNRKN